MEVERSKRLDRVANIVLLVQRKYLRELKLSNMDTPTDVLVVRKRKDCTVRTTSGAKRGVAIATPTFGCHHVQHRRDPQLSKDRR
jgi:hypothetical protein